MEEEEEKQGIEYDIVREIKRIRELKQISQKDFAEQLGEPLRTYIHFESNKNKKVSADTLFKATEILGIDIIRYIKPELYEAGKDINFEVGADDMVTLIKSNRELSEQVKYLAGTVEAMQKQLNTIESLELILQMARQYKASSADQN
jgi:transcriptional regulator with XRE-family HTH domain